MTFAEASKEILELLDRSTTDALRAAELLRSRSLFAESGEIMQGVSILERARSVMIRRQQDDASIAARIAAEEAVRR